MLSWCNYSTRTLTQTLLDVNYCPLVYIVVPVVYTSEWGNFILLMVKNDHTVLNV